MADKRFSQKRAYRRNYAKRCFRDIADYDYISARTLFCNGCFDQFLVLSQQSIEKYLKGILLYNEIKFKSPKHPLSNLSKKCEKRISFVDFNDVTKKFIEQLDGSESIRYLTYSFSAHKDYLLKLDYAVFDIRKFCQSDAKRVKKIANLNEEDLKRLNRANLIIPNGELEKISKNQKNKYKTLRRNLIWKNFYFGKQSKKTIQFREGFWAKNAPICTESDRPMYEAVKNLVYLPKAIHKFFGIKSWPMRLPERFSKKRKAILKIFVSFLKKNP